MRKQKVTESNVFLQNLSNCVCRICNEMQLWAVAELFVIHTSSIFARVHLDLVSLWALTRLTHQVAASQRKHCCVKTDRRKARRQRVGGSRACGWAPCLDAWAAHSALQRGEGWGGGWGESVCVLQQVVCVNFRFDFSLFKTDVK